MAVIGISRSETFEYVLDSDPCKKRVELDVPRIEDAAPEDSAACGIPGQAMPRAARDWADGAVDRLMQAAR